MVDTHRLSQHIHDHLPNKFKRHSHHHLHVNIDKQHQILFTILWTSFLSFSLLCLFPRVYRWHKRWWKGLLGVWPSSWYESKYFLLDGEEEKHVEPKNAHFRGTRLDTFCRETSLVIDSVSAFLSWTPPNTWGLSYGPISTVIIYGFIILFCTFHVIGSINRFAFLALAQLPFLFLLSAKSSPIHFVLLSSPHLSYTKLNFLHRWVGRFTLSCALVHGTYWITHHLLRGIPILGAEKETWGLIALGFLLALGLLSVRWIRERSWRLFSWIHFLSFPAFFLGLWYHTRAASQWIFLSLAIYTFNIAWRVARMRAKDAFLLRVDDTMTLIHIPDCDTGFRGGQHLLVRVLFDLHQWSSVLQVARPHPLSIATAPAGFSCISFGDIRAYTASFGLHRVDGDETDDGKDKEPAGIVLGAQVAGDWTKALNKFAASHEVAPLVPVPVKVVFDGPYGGCTLEPDTYKRVVIISGGSGATFGLGVLDELVARVCSPRRIVAGSQTRRVDFAWCVRSRAAVSWFVPILRAISERARSRNESSARNPIDLHMTIYVTRASEVGDDDLGIPGLVLRVGARPNFKMLLEEIMMADVDGVNSEELERRHIDENCVGTAVCVSGPESLASTVGNAVSAIVLESGRKVDLHREVFGF